MYNLENGVTWTDDLKNAFKTGITHASVIYNNTNYNETNFLKEAELIESRYVPDVGIIGQATARMLTINMVNDENSNLNFENADIEFKIGASYNNNTYYINYGNFIVNEPPENDDTNGTVKFVAYDYMIKFNQPYEDRVTYPCTLLELLEDICDQAGVELATDTFANYDFVVVNNQFEGKTLREVLQHIAKCAFSWARIGQDNQLYLDFEVNNIVDETITTDDYMMDSFKKANEFYGPINKVTFADSDITGEEISVKDTASITLNGEKELIIYDNYFAYTTEKRQELIQAGTRLFGLTYMPVQQLDMVGLAYLDSNDILGIEDGNENTFLTRNFSHIIKYNGALLDSIETEGTSETEEEYSNPNSAVNNAIKMSRAVDRANGTIEQLISTTVVVYDEVEGLGLLTTKEAKEMPTWIVRLTGNKTYDSGAQVVTKDYTLIVMPERYPFIETETDGYLLTESGENIIYSAHKYTIECNELLKKDDVSDTIEIGENRKIIHTQRIGILNGETYILDEPIITELGTLTIDMYSGINYIYLNNDEETTLYVKYILENDFTNNYVSGVDIISRINQSLEEISIQANKLTLEGYTTINGGFKVDEEGNAEIANGAVKINTEGIQMASGTKIIGDDGLLTNLQFFGTTVHTKSLRSSITGNFDTLGFENDEIGTGDNTRTAMYIFPKIPDNFTIISAKVTLRHYPLKLYGNSGAFGWGYARKLKLYQGNTSVYGDYDIFEGVYVNDRSTTEISNAFGSNGFTPSIPSNTNQVIDEATSIDISNYISGDNYFVIKSGDTIPTYTGDTDTDFANCAYKTGMVSASLDILGYLKEEE